MLRLYLTLIGLALALGLAWTIFPSGEKERAAYQELVKSSTPVENEALLSFSQHKRGEVRKRIWYQDDTPLHILIDSPESELFFFRQNHKVEMIEQLANVTCIMQEELFYKDGRPMQKVRYLEAVRGCYHYNTHLFVAEEVKLWKYLLEGHQPPETIDNGTPLMAATAESIEFSLKGKKLDFLAHKMRAILNSKEREL